MPDVDLPTWVDVLLILGLVAGSITALAVLTVKTGRGVKWLTDVISEAAREGVVSVVNDRIGPVEDDLSDIKAELRRDGGLSLRDAVDRIEHKQTQDSEALWRHLADDRKHR